MPKSERKSFQTASLDKWLKAPPLGKGYDPSSGQLENECIDYTKIAHIHNTPRTFYEIVFLASLEDLSQFLDLQTGNHFNLDTNQFNSKTNFFKLFPFHNFSYFYGIKKYQKVLTLSVENPRLKTNYLDYLQEQGSKEFVERCGFTFIKTIKVYASQFLIVEIPSKSTSQMALIQRKLSGLHGKFSSKNEFRRALARFGQLPNIKVYGPLGKTNESSSEAIANLLKDSLTYPEEIRIKTAHYPNLSETVIQMYEQKKNANLALLSQLFNAQLLKNNMMYIQSHQDEFINPNLTAVHEFLQLLNQRIGMILYNGKNCAYNRQKCENDLPDFAAFELPKRFENTSETLSFATTCETPVYNIGRGISCGVESYLIKRSKFCGVELYKLATHSRCPGYEAPGGPKILKEEFSSCKFKMPSVKERKELDAACAKEFGKKWVFSDITEEYSHRPLTCPDGSNQDSGKIFYRCIKLARLASCRHPAHGVEQYKECEHPAHGVAKYHKCRSPEFGIQYYETVGCE